MEIVLTMDGFILQKDEIDEMQKTPEGRQKLKAHMFASKTAFCTNQLLNYLENEANILNRKFTHEEQQIIASLVYWSIFDSKWNVVEQYIRDVVQAYEKGDLDEFLCCGSNCGNC
jgi:hypothetical protein